MKYFGYALVFLIVTVATMINLGLFIASILGIVVAAFAAMIFQSATSAVSKDNGSEDDISEQTRLGLMYENGEGVPQNYSMAMECYAKAAKRGDVKAQFRLGGMYLRGLGVESNFPLGVEWYQKAAKQGYADAQNELSSILRLLVPRNEEMADYWLQKAVKSYRKAAELGDASAQYNLASFFRGGRGVLANDDEAVYWYRKAAENGYPDAQFELGRRNTNGQWGAVPNWIEAHKWYSLAERDKKIQERLEQLATIAKQSGIGGVPGSKYCEEHMTVAEIATAEAAAQEWLNNHN